MTPVEEANRFSHAGSSRRAAPGWILLVLCGLIAELPVALAGRASDLEMPAYSRGYDVNRDPYADGAAALELARTSGRRVLIEVGGDWCAWCGILDRFISGNPVISRALEEHFVHLKVNVSETNDNAGFMAGLPRPLGYPHMYVAGSDGSILVSQDTARFLVDGAYSAERFLEFIQQWGP